MKQRKEYVSVLVCALLLVALYFPATSGALYYDDYANLDGLTEISGTESALDFVLGGTAGPLGRPIALATFLPFAEAWPENSASILFFNILVHAANFVLVYLIGYVLLGQTGRRDKDTRFKIALTAALMWAVLPMLASTSLIAIQRMTGLASFFGLLGLLGFTAAYRLYERKPLTAFIVQFGSLGAGTLLSIFTKESGAIFPVFALIIDVYVRQAHDKPFGYDRLRRYLLLAPLLFILYYISPLKYDWFRVSEFRGFSPIQRLFNEFYILWDYLYKTFLPQTPRQFGPFHDYYGAQAINLKFMLAGGAWAVVLALAVLFRKKLFWFSFAIFWYVVAHLIESTTILLELYFEHRNYLAVYGFCLAITVAVFDYTGRLRKAFIGLLYLYIALLASILLALTTLWGNPREAAESWSAAHPGSARAALHAVFLETSQDQLGAYQNNQEYITKERFDFALRVLDRTKRACPDCVDIRLQALMYACLVTDDEDKLSRVEEILQVAPSASINVTVVDQTFNLAEMVDKSQCGPVDDAQLLKIIESLELARKFDVPEFGAKISFVKAMVQERMGNDAQAWQSLLQAEQISLNAMPVLQYQVYLALKEGRIEDAKRAVDRRRPLVASDKLTQEALDSLMEMINSEAQ